MYERHFGLKSRLFGANAAGTPVFVGPRQDQTIRSIQKGLSAPDAVVTVTGPVGVGKTTIVNRALETLPTGRTAAQIGRMHLSQAEVIDLLMAGFGIKQKTSGAIRRYAAFRRMLQQQSENGIPVAIVIEDAQRLGADALAEVEALTAADAGDKASGNIILMGQPGLHDLLSTPDLARLKQRVRSRQSVAPLSLPEVNGYLKHSVREAGGDYDTLFEQGVADIIFACSEGIPRIINTIVDAALTTAMEDNDRCVNTALMSRVAADICDYVADPVTVIATAPVPAKKQVEANDEQDIDWEAPPVPVVAEVDRPESGSEQQHAAGSDDELEIGHDIVVESGRYPETAPVDAPLPIKPADEITHHNDSDLDENELEFSAIPDLINDTQPELPRLNPVVHDIPVLEPHADPREDIKADAEDDESDIESTQTFVQPVGLETDEPGAKAAQSVAAPVEDRATEQAIEEDFDLDAALSPEVESTNVMQAITPNLDTLASEPPEPVLSQETAQLPPARDAVVKPEPVDDGLPTLSDSMRVEVKTKPTHEKKPETVTSRPVAAVPVTVEQPDAPAMREPTGRATPEERNSDIDALEAALAAAKNGAMTLPTEISTKAPEIRAAAPKPASTVPAGVPEITLDKAITGKPPRNDDLEQFREEIGRANSLEDISDVMAETLFGCEAFDQIAAEVVANPPNGFSKNGEASNPSPVMLTDNEMPSAANDAAELALDPEPPELVAAPQTPKAYVPPIDSTALRINLLNAMKSNAAAAAENVELGSDDLRKSSPSAKGPQPEPIEQQINTSITQTLEALNLSKMAESNEAENEEKKSGGLFSRFKK